MKNFTVLRNAGKDKDNSVSAATAGYLIERGMRCTITDSGTEIPADTDCVLVLGGDGTMLRAARQVVDRQIPLLGINLGTLGYLAEIDRSSVLPALECLLNGQYSVEKRMMLEGTVFHEGRRILTDLALNEVTIARQGHLRVMRFKNYVNNEFLNAYQADGIIIATPTGSTGYSLSAGGPIVSPEAELLLLTPLAAHALNTRSIIFSGSDSVTVEVGEGHSDMPPSASVIFDGENRINAVEGDQISVRKAEKYTNVIKISNISFLEVLRRKMADS